MSTVDHVPTVGTTIELSLADDVSVTADVRTHVGPAVWLTAPPVVHPGRTLNVSWRSGGRTLTAAGRVADSTEDEASAAGRAGVGVEPEPAVVDQRQIGLVAGGFRHDRASVRLGLPAVSAARG